MSITNEEISHRRNISSCKRNILPILEDSGYSSDDANVSHPELKNSAELSKSLVQLNSADLSWKFRLRISSTPILSDSIPAKFTNSSDLQTNGPLLRSKANKCNDLKSSVSFDFSQSKENICRKPRNSRISQSFKCKREKKSAHSKSPIKSQSRSIKKYKSLENVSENSCVDAQLKKRAVRALFCCNVPPVSPVSSPGRRASPRFTNILTQIKDGAYYLLPKVFSYLSDQDLVAVAQVCRQFRDVVHGNSSLAVRKNVHIQNVANRAKELGKENFPSITLSSLRYTRSTPRKHLQELQARSPSRPMIHSPIKPMSRFEKFVKEGKNLLAGEVQQKCVMCQYPAHVTVSESRGKCKNERCAYEYCTRCTLPYHPSSQCHLAKTNPTKPRISAVKILSKACKKRLRRL